MSRNYKIRDQQKLYFVSFATVNRIDVSIRREYREIEWAASPTASGTKGPGGVCLVHDERPCALDHWLNGSEGGRRLNRHSSKALLKAIADQNKESRKEWVLWMFGRAGRRNFDNTKYLFWQQHNQPIGLWRDELMDQMLHYLPRNPVEAGWVEEPEWRS